MSCNKHDQASYIAQLEADISTLNQEHTSLRARTERLEAENEAAEGTIGRLMLEVNRLNAEAYNNKVRLIGYLFSWVHDREPTFYLPSELTESMKKRAQPVYVPEVQYPPIKD